MATTTVGNVLSSHSALYPPPLFIQKQPRKGTFRWRKLRKLEPSQSRPTYPFGPLDDIIDEIKSDIWESPPKYSIESISYAWATSLGVPSSWTATSLPISSTPRDKPLTIRKNRNSHSSASGSNKGLPTPGSHNNIQIDSIYGGTGGIASTPWPLIDDAEPVQQVTPPYAQDAALPGGSVTREGIETLVGYTESRPEATQRRPSRLRQLTNGFSRLRRSQTGGSSATTSESSSGMEKCPHNHEPSEEDIEAYMRKNVWADSKVGSFMHRVASRLPSPVGYEPETSGNYVPGQSSGIPTTMRAAVRLLPDTKLLTNNIQDITVAIEIEGVLHNRQPLADPAVDVVFLVDNGYYVTDECLQRALDAVAATLYHLRRGDRAALYTTHCTHSLVSGNRPDLYFPMQPFDTDSEGMIRKLMTHIPKFGTQGWTPPRPNPPMAEVILCLARSMKDQDLKTGRTHIILLSPAPQILHNVSKHFPDLYVHQINPAPLPYYRDIEKQNVICNAGCCKKVVASNLACYQSFPSRIQRILKDARSLKPIGELNAMSIDIRPRNGCELVEIYGSREVVHLRLGQIHTLFAHIRVTRNEAQDADLKSKNPIFNSSLEVNGLRLELQNAATVGASKVHVLDVQILYHDSLHSQNSWAYSEAPLLLYRELGGLAMPMSVASEVYKRDLFHKLIQLSPEVAITEVANILASLDDQASIKGLAERLARELERHTAIQEYERNYRQRLPHCPGPIEIESSPHEWLEDLRNKRSRRRDASGVNEQGLAKVIAGIHSLDRLG